MTRGQAQAGGEPKGFRAVLAAMRLQTETITEASALKALAPDWQALFDRCPDATPFQSPAWLLAWLEVFRPAALFSIAVRADGELVGLAPFYLHEGGGTAQLTLLGNGASDHLDLLALPEATSAVAAAIAERLDAERTRWRTWDLRDLPAQAPLALMEAPGTDSRLEPEAPCPLLHLPDRPDEVLGRLRPRSRRDLVRRGRRLAEAGEVAFETAQDEETCHAWLDVIIDLHEARWRERGEPGVFADPSTVRFHHAANRDLLAAGLLRLHVLKLGGRIIAGLYALHRGLRTYGYVQAFDPTYAEYAPGGQIMRHAIETAVREGGRTFDFLRGQEAYKYLWGAVDQPKARRRVWQQADQRSSGASMSGGGSRLASRA